MSEMVTDAMVDAAAEAAYTMAAWDAQNFTGTNWTELDPAHRTPWLREAEAALEVVAPLIAAKALQDAADELRRLDDGREGGYYEAGRHIINRLDARADRIERGES